MITKKMDSLSIRQSVETLVSLPTKVDEPLLLKPTVQQLNITVATVHVSIELFSSKYDSLLASVMASKTTAKELRAETSSLRPVVADQFAAFKHLQADIERCRAI